MNARVSAISARTFSALRFRNYRLYFASQAVSFSGTWMQLIAQSWLVLQLTGSGTALGTVMAMQFLPTLLLAPFGGMIADRYDKRRLIMATQSIAGLLALTLGIVTITGTVELWMVYAIAAGFGAVTAVDNPSRQTFVMEMVGPADVSNAVTLNSVVVNTAAGDRPGHRWRPDRHRGDRSMLRGQRRVLPRCRDRPGADPNRRTPPLGAQHRAPRQLRDGFHYAWNTTTLRTTLVMLVVIGTLTYEFSTTLPLFAEFTFGAGASGLAVMTSLMGAGAVVGGLVVASSGAATPRRFVMVAATFGLLVCLLASMPTLVTAYAVLPFVGAASVGTISLSNATLQLNSDAQFRGRVMALFSMALLGSTPIGGPIAGWIAEHVSPRASLFIGGSAALLAALYGWRMLSRNAALDAVAAIEPAMAS